MKDFVFFALVTTKALFFSPIFWNTLATLKDLFWNSCPDRRSDIFGDN